jgi:hypothetical protein
MLTYYRKTYDTLHLMIKSLSIRYGSAFRGFQLLLPFRISSLAIVKVIPHYFAMGVLRLFSKGGQIPTFRLKNNKKETIFLKRAPLRTPTLIDNTLA